MTKEQKQKNRDKAKAWYYANKDRARTRIYARRLIKRDEINSYLREYGKKTNAEYRKLLIEKLGNVCARCNYSDIRALQIDHINGDGFLERAPGSKLRHFRYKNKLEDPEANKKYQVLCANCNQIKRIENGEHVGGKAYEAVKQNQKVD